MLSYQPRDSIIWVGELHMLVIHVCKFVRCQWTTGIFQWLLEGQDIEKVLQGAMGQSYPMQFNGPQMMLLSNHTQSSSTVNDNIISQEFIAKSLPLLHSHQMQPRVTPLADTNSFNVGQLMSTWFTNYLDRWQLGLTFELILATYLKHQTYLIRACLSCFPTAKHGSNSSA